jgi:hypothetical protein
MTPREQGPLATLCVMVKEIFDGPFLPGVLPEAKPHRPLGDRVPADLRMAGAVLIDVDADHRFGDVFRLWTAFLSWALYRAANRIERVQRGGRGWS